MLWHLMDELRAYLDQQTITGENIGDIRRSCFVPWDSRWNGIVRDETAKRETRVEAVPSPPAPLSEGREVYQGVRLIDPQQAIATLRAQVARLTERNVALHAEIEGGSLFTPQFGLRKRLELAEEHAKHVEAQVAQLEQDDDSCDGLLQSILVMLGLPGHDDRWFDDRGRWDFGALRRYGLDARIAEIRQAEAQVAQQQEDIERLTLARQRAESTLSTVRVDAEAEHARLTRERDEASARAVRNDAGWTVAMRQRDEAVAKLEAHAAQIRALAEEMDAYANVADDRDNHRLSLVLKRYAEVVRALVGDPAPTGKES